MPVEAKTELFDTPDFDLFELFSADLRNQQVPDGLTPSQTLVLENVSLAISIAAKVYRQGVIGGHSNAQFTDVVQAGIMGLIRSLDRYDHERGEFHDFAAPAIKGECWREVELWMSPIRFPVPIRDEMRKTANVRNRAGNPAAAVIQELGVSHRKAEKLLGWLDLENVVSLEAPDRLSPDGGDDLTLADHILDETELETTVMERLDFMRAWEKLSLQEQQMLSERFVAEPGEGMEVNEELACRFGVTSRCIRRRQRKAMQRLKSELE